MPMIKKKIGEGYGKIIWRECWSDYLGNIYLIKTYAAPKPIHATMEKTAKQSIQEIKPL